MSDSPAISVIVPAYNGANYLAEALASIRAQSLPAAEVIVVDDGSTDGTVAVANGFGGNVCCLSQANRGPAAARNAGIAAATGDFLAFLDHDDLWTEHALRDRYQALATNPDAGLAFGRIVQFRQATGTQEPPANAPFAGTMLARRAAIERVGLFNPDFRVGEYIDWFARARDAGILMVNIDTVVLRRRLHDSNMGLRLAAGDGRTDYARVLRAGLVRKRASREPTP